MRPRRVLPLFLALVLTVLPWAAGASAKKPSKTVPRASAKAQAHKPRHAVAVPGRQGPRVQAKAKTKATAGHARKPAGTHVAARKQGGRAVTAHAAKPSRQAAVVSARSARKSAKPSQVGRGTKVATKRHAGRAVGVPKAKH